MNIDTFINTVMTSGRPFAVRENRALSERQRKAHRLCWKFNQTDPTDGERQQEILRDLFGTMEGPGRHHAEFSMRLRLQHPFPRLCISQLQLRDPRHSAGTHRQCCVHRARRHHQLRRPRHGSCAAWQGRRRRVWRRSSLRTTFGSAPVSSSGQA